MKLSCYFLRLLFASFTAASADKTLFSAVRRKLAVGIDPAQAGKAHAATQAENVANSSDLVAREWFSKFGPSWVPVHSTRVLRLQENDVFPWIGAMSIASATPPILLATMRLIEARGTVETTRRILQSYSQIFLASPLSLDGLTVIPPPILPARCQTLRKSTSRLSSTRDRFALACDAHV